jgi:hypothetical protein
MRSAALWLLAAALTAVAAGCTKEKRTDCFVCNAFGVCAILGDDQAEARRRHPAWFLFPPPPGSRSTTQPAESFATSQPRPADLIAKP